MLSGVARSGAMWDPEEVLPAYSALLQLVELHRPAGRRAIEIIDGEHGFYTVCVPHSSFSQEVSLKLQS